METANRIHNTQRQSVTRLTFLKLVPGSVGQLAYIAIVHSKLEYLSSAWPSWQCHLAHEVESV